MDGLCGKEPVWDTNLTWKGEWPQFTECFQHTVLVWVTCGLLWITSPLYVFYLSLRPVNSLPLTSLFIAKLFTCAALVVVRLIQILSIATHIDTMHAEASDFGIHIATYILAISLFLMEKRKGVITSPVLFCFWFLSVVGNIIPFYSKIKLKEYEDDMFSFSLFYVVYGLTVIGFLLSCFAEKIPLGSYNTNGNPEVAASVLSRLTFWWANRMLIQGYKGLQEDQLIPLNPRDLTAFNVPIFQTNLRNHIDKNKRLAEERELRLCNLKSTHKIRDFHPIDTESNLCTFYSKTDEKTPLLQTRPKAAQESKDRGQRSASRWDMGRLSGRVSIFWVAWKTFWWQLLCYQSIMVLQMIAVLVSPLFLREMINFTKDSTEAVWKGYLFAVAIFLLSCLQSISQRTGLFHTTCLAMRVSAALTSAVYRKSLTMNSRARQESKAGEIVNLMSVDARNIEQYITFSFWVWLSPANIVVALYLLYTTVGVSMFAGLGMMALLFGINTTVMNKLRINQKAIMTIRDKRIKVINEILDGIKVLKLYAWEPSFEEKVTEIREEELGVLLKTSFMESFFTFSWTAAIYWMTLFTFMTYVFVDDSHNLDASTSFVALSYFNVINLSLNRLPIMIREGIKCYVSLGRFDKFLNTPDLDTDGVSRDFRPDNAIEVTSGTFAWDRDRAPTLRDIQFNVKRGSLVAVVGQVGAGKSSIVSAILGEMETLSGHVNIDGSVAYVPQQAWIQNDTVRNNILFGKDLDEHKYQRVLDACALRPDLEILSGGDMTEIGEKGINLSGGQKQRVSVARAVYSDADVFLLDDPLSAVDSHVGKHIFHQVIGKGGHLQGKTRVLVTHGLQWLPMADYIVVMTDGRVSELGSYEQLMTHNGPFAQFIAAYFSQHMADDCDEDEDEEVKKMKAAILERLVSVTSDTDSDTEGKMGILQLLKSQESDNDQSRLKPRRRRSRMESESSVGGQGQRDTWILKGEQGKAAEKASKIITAEDMESGRVSLKVYLELARALGGKYSVVMLLLFTLYNVGSLGGNLWLSAWTDNTELGNITALPPDSPRRADLNDFYLGIYAALGIGQSVFVVAYAVLMAFRRVHASRILHRRMLNRLLRAPMAFFDTTPIGRVVNRFSQDMDTLDTRVCIDIELYVKYVGRLVSVVIAITYSDPIFLAVFTLACIVYYWLLQFYIRTSCQLRRLQSKQRSPIYSHFGESLVGAHVIRAYGAQRRFVHVSQGKMDGLITCTYNANAAGRWLGIRLDFVGSILVLAAAMFAVVSRDTLSAGVVGLSLSYSIQVTDIMYLLVRFTSDMEADIVSVERISEFTRIESEAPWTVLPRPRQDWPKLGRLRFQNYSARYRPGLDLVLKNLTCDFEPGEKVGIVGRTGAGKSSLTLAIFRLIEAAAGSVTVDEVDIASLGLHDLRQRINILPQDPVIFDGSIRMNLDPFDTHDDARVWQALEQAHLKTYVSGLPDRLDHVCGEGGGNLSVGQRQLLCLARSLLRQTRILILDEATAAVDMETDELIQRTIRTAFSDCTVLTIAHRINTVMDYDRILMLDSGRLVEFDSPRSLLNNPSSAFYKMAKDAGLVNTR